MVRPATSNRRVISRTTPARALVSPRRLDVALARHYGTIVSVAGQPLRGLGIALRFGVAADKPEVSESLRQISNPFTQGPEQNVA